MCNQARSGGDGPLLDLDADQMDGHWKVDARATLLRTQHFARQHDGRPGRRVVWFTSGQQLGRGILLNVINPGPVDTGYLTRPSDLDPERLDELRAAFPQGRFGEPDDPARLVAWLVSDDGRWVVGQVIDSEGGFRRW